MIEPTLNKKDLGVKIGSKEEAEWTRIKNIQEENIRVGKINNEIAEAVLELTKKRIEEEKKKFSGHGGKGKS